jgi:GTP-binding protein
MTSQGMVEIKQARFLVSNSEVDKCPTPDKPEYAFTGRSNVGKSSLINMLTNRKSLAKVSETPGKTKLINHFLIDGAWYLVDLPGYGYAKVSKQERGKWISFFRRYILERKNLCCLFVLVDIRHDALKTDLDFMEWLGINEVPLAVVFTKSDKLKPCEVEPAVQKYLSVLAETWEPLPPHFVTSSVKATGKCEILRFIQDINKSWK